MLKNRTVISLLLICGVATLGGLLFGYDTAVISGTQSQVQAKFTLSEWMLGWFNSSALVGCIFGALVSGMMGDHFGRKPSLIVSGILFFISAVLTAIAWSFPVLIAARIIGGVGIGIVSGLVPTYISEFAEAEYRGRMVATYQLSIVVGMLAAYFVNWLILRHAQSFVGNETTVESTLFHQYFCTEYWRGMFFMEAIPAGLFTALLFTIPESFRWLVGAGKREKALRIAQTVYGTETADRMVSEIVSTDAEESSSLSEIFRPGFRTALLVAVGLSVFGQLTGVNVVLYYGPKILESAGLTTGGALFSQAFIGLVNLVFTIIAIWKIDRWGRRPLLIYGMAGVTVSMGATALCMYLKTSPYLIVAMMGCSIAFIAVSVCAVIWVLTPEILPNRVRARAVSIATFANWSTNALAAQFFPWYVDRFGAHGGFATFAVLCLIGTVFFWRLVPETKGKSLEEIERHWLK